MTDAFVGIDVAYAKGKLLPVSVCRWQDGRLVPAPLRLLPLRPPPVGHGNLAALDDAGVGRFARQAASYVLDVCEALGAVPRRIAIDAPSAPRAQGVGRRAAEAAMDGARIRCFTTPTAAEFAEIRNRVHRHVAGGGPENRLPHANQLWMLVGFRLFRELGAIAPCLEVFPQAIARVLGSGLVHKFKAGGVEAQLSEVARHTGWPSDDLEGPRFSDIAFGPPHDRLDAYLSAWVAALEESDRVPFGSPPDDVIWTPRVGSVPVAPRPRPPEATSPTTPRALRSSAASGAPARPCPGCGKHVFKRWPWGWDAHAAHRCSGLGAGTGAERKREFKQRFGHLFAGAVG